MSGEFGPTTTARLRVLAKMITYYSLGAGKRLNGIVIAGSHDAGITSGKGNVKTQNKTIGAQAHAGVRIFDLRIAAAAAGYNGTQDKKVELKAFHAADLVKKDESKMRVVPGLGAAPQQVVRTKLYGGDFGLGLADMLESARRFVTSPLGGTEFLILKFDKCKNWQMIAQMCVEKLGSTILTGGSNLNLKTLDELQGKVIVLFSEAGALETQPAYGPPQGILSFRNLHAGGGYDPKFAGLQYYGKGGTSVIKPFYKRSQNEKKQKSLLNAAKDLQSPQVIGMMYWTTTGMLESIKKRNDGLWSAPNVERMKALWSSGLRDMVERSNPHNVPNNPAPFLKKFMPNIVMIDFADDRKCQIVRDLNDLSDEALAKLIAANV